MKYETKCAVIAELAKLRLNCTDPQARSVSKRRLEVLLRPMDAYELSMTPYPLKIYELTITLTDKYKTL